MCPWFPQKRPLHESLVNYCVADVKYLFEMKAKWGAVISDEALKKISQVRTVVEVIRRSVRFVA